MLFLKYTYNSLLSFHLDIVQNTFYKDCGARVRFTKLSNVLAKEFPPQKLENLKFTLTSKWFLQAKAMIYCFDCILYYTVQLV